MVSTGTKFELFAKEYLTIDSLKQPAVVLGTTMEIIDFKFVFPKCTINIHDIWELWCPENSSVEYYACNSLNTVPVLIVALCSWNIVCLSENSSVTTGCIWSEKMPKKSWLSILPWREEIVWSADFQDRAQRADHYRYCSIFNSSKKAVCAKNVC